MLAKKVRSQLNGSLFNLQKKDNSAQLITKKESIKGKAKTPNSYLSYAERKGKKSTKKTKDSAKVFKEEEK